MVEAIRKEKNYCATATTGRMDNGSHEKKKEIMRQLQQMLMPVVDALLWVNDNRGHQQTASKPLQQSILMSRILQNIQIYILPY